MRKEKNEGGDLSPGLVFPIRNEKKIELNFFEPSTSAHLRLTNGKLITLKFDEPEPITYCEYSGTPAIVKRVAQDGMLTVSIGSIELCVPYTATKQFADCRGTKKRSPKLLNVAYDMVPKVCELVFGSDKRYPLTYGAPINVSPGYLGSKYEQVILLEVTPDRTLKVKRRESEQIFSVPLENS